MVDYIYLIFGATFQRHFIVNFLRIGSNYVEKRSLEIIQQYKHFLTIYQNNNLKLIIIIFNEQSTNVTILKCKIYFILYLCCSVVLYFRTPDIERNTEAIMFLLK